MAQLWRSPWLDPALAALFAVLVVAEATSLEEGPVAVMVTFGLLCTLGVALRRRSPLLAQALAVVPWAAIGLIDHPAFEPQTPLIPLLLLTVSIGAVASRSHARVGLALTIVALLVHEAGDAIVLGPLFTGAWLVGRLLHERASVVSVLEATRDDHAREAIAAERARIARELHDVVAHQITTIAMHAGAERLALGDERPQTRAALATIEGSAREALVEMRRMLGLLREDGVGAGLDPQPGLGRLEELVDQVRAAGLDVSLRHEGEWETVPAGVDISAYRIVQEALTNALRHAGAGRAEVVVHHGVDVLRVTICDDGRGACEAGPGGGHGLAGMRERVAILGGRLETGPRPQGGFQVEATLPLAA